jgi:hypothetical protein
VQDDTHKAKGYIISQKLKDSIVPSNFLFMQEEGLNGRNGELDIVDTHAITQMERV